MQDHSAGADAALYSGRGIRLLNSSVNRPSTRMLKPNPACASVPWNWLTVSCSGGRTREGPSRNARQRTMKGGMRTGSPSCASTAGLRMRLMAPRGGASRFAWRRPIPKRAAIGVLDADELRVRIRRAERTGKADAGLRIGAAVKAADIDVHVVRARPRARLSGETKGRVTRP
jgi:hypothetical protein